jgi:hypothetical protein
MTVIKGAAAIDDPMKRLDDPRAPWENSLVHFIIKMNVPYLVVIH